MAQQISKIIKSDTPPVNTNTLWLDTKKNELKSYTPNGWKSVKGDSGNIKVKATSKKPIIVGRYIPVNAEVGDRYFCRDRLTIKIPNNVDRVGEYNSYKYNDYIKLHTSGIITIPEDWDSIVTELIYYLNEYTFSSPTIIELGDIYNNTTMPKELLQRIEDCCSFAEGLNCNTTSPNVKIVDRKLYIDKPIPLSNVPTAHFITNFYNRKYRIYVWKGRCRSNWASDYSNKYRRISRKFRPLSSFITGKIKYSRYFKIHSVFRKDRISHNYTRFYICLNKSSITNNGNLQVRIF